MPKDISSGRHRGKKKIVSGVAADSEYPDKMKISWTILDSVEVKTQHFLADTT